MNGATGNILSTIANKITRNYTNANHPCPYSPGINYAKANSVPLHVFNFGHILPSGRGIAYKSMRLNFLMARFFTRTKSYASVSDRRVTKF